MDSAHRPPLEEVEGNIVMGNGTTVQPVGMATFTLDFGNIKVPYSMVVADLEVTGVIGYDFLYSHGGLVDVQQGTVTISGHKLKCKLESRLPSLFRIILKENVTVPLRAESLTTGVVKTKRHYWSMVYWSIDLRLWNQLQQLSLKTRNLEQWISFQKYSGTCTCNLPRSWIETESPPDAPETNEVKRNRNRACQDRDS
jgi:hypothetical protein